MGIWDTGVAGAEKAASGAWGGVSGAASSLWGGAKDLFSHHDKAPEAPISVPISDKDTAAAEKQVADSDAFNKSGKLNPYEQAQADKAAAKAKVDAKEDSIKADRTASDNKYEKDLLTQTAESEAQSKFFRENGYNAPRDWKPSKAEMDAQMAAAKARRDSGK